MGTLEAIVGTALFVSTMATMHSLLDNKLFQALAWLIILAASLLSGVLLLLLR